MISYVSLKASGPPFPKAADSFSVLSKEPSVPLFIFVLSILEYNKSLFVYLSYSLFSFWFLNSSSRNSANLSTVVLLSFVLLFILLMFIEFLFLSLILILLLRVFLVFEKILL